MKKTSDKVLKIVNELLLECGDDIPADCLIKLANKNNITVAKTNRPDISKTKGMLDKNGNKYTLCVNTYRNRQTTDNFTIAHELGHFYLKHLEKENTAKEYAINEKEANEFVYEFLMPQSMFELFFGSSSFDFTTINSVAEYFKVSKIVAAFRFVQLSNYPMAVIQTSNNIIKQFEKSSSFNYNIKRIGERVAIKNQTDFNKVEIFNWLTEPLPKGFNLYELTKSKDNNALTLLRIQKEN